MVGSSTVSSAPSWRPISASFTNIWASRRAAGPQDRMQDMRKSGRSPMKCTMKQLVSLSALALALEGGASTAQAQYTDGTIKIGVMNDMSGTYSDLSGQGSVV